MHRQKVIITLGAQELQEVERIAVDRDNLRALEFVRKIIKPRVDVARRAGFLMRNRIGC